MEISIYVEVGSPQFRGQSWNITFFSTYPIKLFRKNLKKKKMGGGNGQKSKMARERNLEKQKQAKGALPFLFLFCLVAPEWKREIIRRRKRE